MPPSNNLLYPHQDRDRRLLLYMCKHCQHSEVASSNCVYTNHIATKHTSFAINGEVTQDPALPRMLDKPCPNCGHYEAVYMTAGAGARDDAMKLVFVCCDRDCGHWWREA